MYVLVVNTVFLYCTSMSCICNASGPLVSAFGFGEVGIGLGMSSVMLSLCRPVSIAFAAASHYNNCRVI